MEILKSDVESIYKLDLLFEIVVNIRDKQGFKRVEIFVFIDNNLILETAIIREYYLEEKIVKHSVCMLSEQYRGQNYLSKFHLRELEFYKKLGFTKIELSATYDGLVVWSRKPFNFQYIDRNDELILIKHFREYLRKHRKMNKVEISTITSNIKFSKDINSKYLKSNQEFKSFTDWLIEDKKSPLAIRMSKEIV